MRAVASAYVMHLIVNPTAGRGRGLPRVDGCVAALRAAGHEVTVHVTQAPEHATAIAQALPAGSTVVAVGGDGTVHELLGACLARDLRLGLLPAGSGDDFAHAIGLDRLDPHAAVSTILAGRERRCDVGTVNQEPFINAFGAGFDAEAARRTLEAPRAFRGLARYVFGILSAMRDFRLARARLELHEATGHRVAFEGPALLVAVQNGPRTGGSFLFAPGARVDDGAFDVLIAGEFGRLGTMGILPRVMRGTHLGHPRVHRFAARGLSLTWSRPMPSHAEGNLLPPADRFEVGMRPGALRVIAP
jgi:diacylglycerol kinase (ATP)